MGERNKLVVDFFDTKYDFSILEHIFLKWCQYSVKGANEQFSKTAYHRHGR